MLNFFIVDIMNPFIDDLHSFAMTQNQLTYQTSLYEVNKIAEDLEYRKLSISEPSSRKQSILLSFKPSDFVS